ncbi:MAG TPA: 50S ribosomal protein L9 [Desulfobulbus sp.]|nr:50S ribosomal protein L9 [Desulfobulbus sp.]
MEIILKETIDTLGLEGDIVNVKPGYARNFLIPQKKAVAVNKAALARLKHEQQAITKRREAEQKKAEALAAKLETKTVIISRRVGSENRLFGSVGTKDIADQLAENGVTLDRRSILLAEPIKNIGETTVTVKVGYQMTSLLTVQIVAEGADSEAAEIPEKTETPETEETAEME